MQVQYKERMAVGIIYLGVVVISGVQTIRLFTWAYKHGFKSPLAVAHILMVILSLARGIGNILVFDKIVDPHDTPLAFFVVVDSMPAIAINCLLSLMLLQWITLVHIHTQEVPNSTDCFLSAKGSWYFVNGCLCFMLMITFHVGYALDDYPLILTSGIIILIWNIVLATVFIIYGIRLARTMAPRLSSIVSWSDEFEDREDLPESKRIICAVLLCQLMLVRSILIGIILRYRLDEATRCGIQIIDLITCFIALYLLRDQVDQHVESPGTRSLNGTIGASVISSVDHPRTSQAGFSQTAVAGDVYENLGD
mmetsp:Transcript_22499/g.42280  ORF Transcript_22499/g.42280 Transcript_22499/m.42280 type:complete len:309 (-) Transcript_22499:92-1018(-)